MDVVNVIKKWGSRLHTLSCRPIRQRRSRTAKNETPDQKGPALRSLPTNLLTLKRLRNVSL